MKNKTKIKIIGLPPYGNTPLEIILKKYCRLRRAKKIGDIEVVNNTQLGELKYQHIPFEIIND